MRQVIGTGNCCGKIARKSEMLPSRWDGSCWLCRAFDFLGQGGKQGVVWFRRDPSGHWFKLTVRRKCRMDGGAAVPQDAHLPGNGASSTPLPKHTQLQAMRVTL